MGHTMKIAIWAMLGAALCGAQTTVNGGRDYKGTLKASRTVSSVDFSGAGSTAPVKTGTLASRRTSCTQGQVYFATDATAGQMVPHRVGRERSDSDHRREAEEDGLQQARDGGRPAVLSRGQVVQFPRLRRRLM